MVETIPDIAKVLQVSRVRQAWSGVREALAQMETLKRKGLETEDFFGFASGKDTEKYLGFHFGDSGTPILDEASVLIENTKLQNTMICQPQQRNTSGRIFGG